MVTAHNHHIPHSLLFPVYLCTVKLSSEYESAQKVKDKGVNVGPLSWNRTVGAQAIWSRYSLKLDLFCQLEANNVEIKHSTAVFFYSNQIWLFNTKIGLFIWTFGLFLCNQKIP